MKDEIKEILDFIDDDNRERPFGISNHDLKILRDYISNLQEENERLKEVIENLTTMTVCGDRKQIKNTAQYKLEVAQSRIEKTREYIKNKQELNKMFGTITLSKDSQNELLNILGGDDNE